MLKWLSNPKYYYINEFNNENFIKNSEYVYYKCKIAGKNH